MPEPHTPNGRWILVTTILASSMAFIDSSALNVALDAIQKALNATGSDLIWVVNAYLLLLASLILIGGSLGDHYGRKRIFRYGIMLFAGASCACGLAPTIGILITARAIQGIGGALMVPGSLAIISATFYPTERGSAIGIWSAAGTLTTIGGPIVGGLLASAGLWRAVFFINLPLAVIALVCLTRVPETRDEQAVRGLDFLGTLFVVLGLTGLTYGSILFSNAAGDPTLALASSVGGFVALGIFVLVEARSKNPLVDLALFRSHDFSGTNLLTLLLYAALAGALFFVPLNLIQIQGYPASAAGLAFLPFSLLVAGISPFTGNLVQRFGPKRLLTVGPALVAAGCMLLSLPGLTTGVGDYFTSFFPGVLAIGLGMGITIAPLTTTVMGAVASHRSGIASGVNNAVARSAQVLATALFGAIALSTFSVDLSARAATLGLPPQAQQALQRESINFGNTQVPADLAPDNQQPVKTAIREAFVDTFRRVALIAAGMALASAVMSLVLISPKLEPADEKEAQTGKTMAE